MSTLDRRPRPSSPPPEAAQPSTLDRAAWLWAAILAFAALLVVGAASARSWLSSHLVPSPTTTPRWWGDVTEVVAETGVLALLGLCMILGLRALRRGRGEAALSLVAAGATVAAYLSSEGLKRLFAQQPCHHRRRASRGRGAHAAPALDAGHRRGARGRAGKGDVRAALPARRACRRPPRIRRRGARSHPAAATCDDSPHLCSCVPNRKGTVTRTVVPEPGTLLTVRLPPHRAARCRIVP